MRKIIPFTFLMLLAIISTPFPRIMNFQNVTAEIFEEGNIELFAHGEDNEILFGENILSTAPPYGILKSSVIDKGLSFYLYPQLTNNLNISGTLNVRLWLDSSISKITSINISLFEIVPENVSTRACSAIINIPAKEPLSQFVFGIPVSHNFTRNSTIQLFIQNLDSEVSLTLYWDDKSAPTSITLPVVNSTYHKIWLQSLDAKDSPLSHANITILSNDLKYWTGFANSSGFVEALLSFSDEDQTYEIRVYWRDLLVNTASIGINEKSSIQLRCDVYDLDIRISDLFYQPFNDAVVSLVNDSVLIYEGTTGPNGSTFFEQIPKGKYQLLISYDIKFLTFSIKNYQKTDLSLVENDAKELRVNYVSERFLSFFISLLILLPILIIGILKIKKKGKIYRLPFDFFNTIVRGEIPPSTAIMIVGNPSSGKTVLLEHLMNESMMKDRPSVFITNLDFPSKVRDSMKEFGFKKENVNLSNKIVFIDCYSETAGQKSSEQYSVSSLDDLTTLGIKISSCLNELGKGTDVFFDSLTPLFPILKQDFIVNFVHAMSAKVKGNEGRFFFTVSTGMEKEVLSKLESTSDCVIEVQLYEEEGNYFRKLRIKKMRKKHIERWVDFSIEDRKGIVFQLRKKPDTE